MRFLVDTNVFLDYLLDRGTLANDAEKFFILCRQGRHQIYVSSMSIRDIGYIAQKQLHDYKKAKQLQSKTYSLCSKVVPLTVEATISGIYEEEKDYEDYLIKFSAEENMCDLVVTNNVKDFHYATMPALSVNDVNKALLYVNKNLDFNN